MSRECTACSLPLLPPFLRGLRPIPRSQTPKECVYFVFLKPFSHCHDSSEKNPHNLKTWDGPNAPNLEINHSEKQPL